jgi:hypothetical protein
MSMSTVTKMKVSAALRPDRATTIMVQAARLGPL